MSSGHAKHLILYHIIFVAKYRRKIFSNVKFGEALKDQIKTISSKYDFIIDTIDLDLKKPDHIHILIRTKPTISPTQIVRVLKQRLLFWAWNNYSEWLKNFYWGNKKKLFTRGYFCSSVGNVSAFTVEQYLERQGGNVA